MLLYTDTWCKDNVYRKENGGKFTFMDGDEVFKSWFKGNTSNVVPEEALDFFRLIMQQGLDQGMGAFEVDFMDYNRNLYKRFRSETGAFAKWVKGIDDAAKEYAIPVQYCMAQPQELVNTVTLGQVTNARISGDGGRPYYNNGATNLLLSALGIRPFKDNAWTHGDYPKGLPDIAGSVLTMGPVGLADKLNTTNASIAAQSCRADGTLLHPNRAATPLDSTYFPTTFSGSIMTASTGPKAADAAWHVLSATDVQAVQVSPSELWPAPVESSQFVWWQRGAQCVPGAQAASCLNPFSGKAPLPVSAASNMIELFNVAPVLSGGWVVLGEASKIVPVAAARVESVQPASGDVAVVVLGSDGESIELLFAKVGAEGRGTGAIISQKLTFGPSGRATIHAVNAHVV
mmetsp:Transcript_21526/g.67224  ORF Transcript_21526/g.67224 Transcript_21526/m.67224 type:complete len:402 (+) Transcript_21526:608-1813(+)